MILGLLDAHSAPFASWHERFNRGRKRDARWPARWLDAALFEGHVITNNFGERGVIFGMEAIAARLHPGLRHHCHDRDACLGTKGRVLQVQAQGMYNAITESNNE